VKDGYGCHTWAMTDVRSLPDPFRLELLEYLLGTTGERAAMIGSLSERTPDMADLLMDLPWNDVPTHVGTMSRDIM
jgi:hypothetical protein